MKLAWVKSGDTIDLEIKNYKVFEYFVNYCNKNNNNCFKINCKFESHKILDDLKKNLDETNKILKYFHITDLDLPVSIDQNELNLLHEKWVILQRKHPMISHLCDKKKQNGKIYFDKINENIHELERSFDIPLYNNMEEPIPNIFNQNITSFDFSNVYLKYKNPGRQTYDKWIYFDKSTSNIDRNDFIEFFGYLNINLNRSFSVSPPVEYIEWCRKNNINEIYGNKIVLANFKNLEENLTLYRELFIKNFINADEVTFVL